MPRNMSFALTTEQFKNRTKTVTRRLGWWFLKPGDVICGVEKCRGLKKGEKIKRLGLIEIVSVRKEQLCEITKEDCLAEGFPNLSVNEFGYMFCKEMNVKPDVWVNRIEFKHVGDLI